MSPVLSLPQTRDNLEIRWGCSVTPGKTLRLRLHSFPGLPAPLPNLPMGRKSLFVSTLNLSSVIITWPCTAVKGLTLSPQSHSLKASWTAVGSLKLSLAVDEPALFLQPLPCRVESPVLISTEVYFDITPLYLDLSSIECPNAEHLSTCRRFSFPGQEFYLSILGMVWLLLVSSSRLGESLWVAVLLSRAFTGTQAWCHL